MIRTKIIYPAQAKNITVYDTDGNIFYDLGYDGFYQDDVDMLLDRLRLGKSGCMGICAHLPRQRYPGPWKKDL